MYCTLIDLNLNKKKPIYLPFESRNLSKKNDQDRHVTGNGNRYRSMITEYFWTELDDMDLDNMWLQQDGATIELLKTKFGERVSVLSRNGPVNWPARSCVRLFPVGLCQVYANKTATIDELRTNTEREIAAVSAVASLLKHPLLCHIK